MQYDKLFDMSVPEIKRVPLSDIALQIKALKISGGNVRKVLANALEAPNPVAVAEAIRGKRVDISLFILCCARLSKCGLMYLISNEHLYRTLRPGGH